MSKVRIRQVALFIETSGAFGRGLLVGIARFNQEHRHTIDRPAYMGGWGKLQQAARFCGTSPCRLRIFAGLNRVPAIWLWLGQKWPDTIGARVEKLRATVPMRIVTEKRGHD